MSTCKWKVASMNANRRDLAMAYFQQKIWAIGGRGGQSNKTDLDTIETYDLVENKSTDINTKFIKQRIIHNAVKRKALCG